MNAPAAEKALQKKVNPEKLVESKENQLQESSENLNKEERKNVMNKLPLA